jgi:hypothetical protein
MKVNVIIAKMYDDCGDDFIAYIFEDKQKANDKLAELSETMIEHSKTNPLYGLNVIDLSTEQDNILYAKYKEWQTINPFPFDGGQDIVEFVLQQHEVI